MPSTTHKDTSEKPKGRPRGKGRPSQAGATVGRDRLMELTVEFLRTRPLPELTIASLAKAANVDPALVRYYFGSKDKLLTELASQLTAERSTAGYRFLSDTGPIEKRFERRLRALLEANAGSPYYHELLVGHIFNREDAAAEEFLEDLARRGLKLANKMIEDGQLRPVDPAFLHMLIIGACSFFVTGRPLVEALRQRPCTGRTLDAYAQFLVDVLMDGLRPR